MKSTNKGPKSSKKSTAKAKPAVTCRFMTKGDIKSVAKVHAEAFDIFSAESAVSSVSDHAGQNKENGAVVAIVGKTIVGYALFSIQEKDMYIGNVGVRKRNRGQGVCGRMIPWLLKRLSCFGCETASLFVVSDTDAAVRCYKSHGFEGDSSSLTYRPSKKRRCPKDSKSVTTCGTGSCH